MADDEEKTEEPTSKKIEDARAEGNVGKSAEVAGAVILTLGSVYLIFLSGFMFLEIKKVMLYIYGFIGQEIDESTYFTITVTVATTLVKALAPIYLLVFVLAFAANWMQFGFIATPLKFDLQKLDPIKGLGNVFSLKKLMEALKLTLKLAVIGGIALLVIGTFIFFKFKDKFIHLPFIGKVIEFVEGIFHGLTTIFKLKQKGKFFILSIAIWVSYNLS